MLKLFKQNPKQVVINETLKDRSFLEKIEYLVQKALVDGIVDPNFAQIQYTSRTEGLKVRVFLSRRIKTRSTIRVIINVSEYGPLLLDTWDFSSILVTKKDGLWLGEIELHCYSDLLGETDIPYVDSLEKLALKFMPDNTRSA